MQSSSNPLQAANPKLSAVVKASAGVGKTYLLVTRLIRLLLAGARPDAILAITFTRKAAAEMQSRLAERLFEYVSSDDEALQQKLLAIGVSPDPQSCAAARQLYERVMKTENPVRATTFHAFCQDILRRFPMEANVPPAFELIDNPAPYLQAAWEALYAEATIEPDSVLAEHLETLFVACNGLANTQEALHSFLDYRSDWWAFCGDSEDPVQYACAQLQQQLRIDPNTDPVGEFFSRLAVDKLEEFAELLKCHANKTNTEILATLLQSLNAKLDTEQRLQYLWSVFYTKTGGERSRKASPTLDKAMTPVGASRFLELHQEFVHSLSLLREQVNRHNTFRNCSAWYFAGQRLLDHYQDLKTDQRCMDFADLEWKAYQLLHKSNNANWVQYKLDQRIDHLLIDEFQDTNPTQWQLVLPLLEELAAQQDGRSAFIVGDDKQSIYAFRRAEPELLEQSAQWLEQGLSAQRFPMDKSRRSAAAIMDIVNLCFTPQGDQQLLNDFHAHSTYNEKLWGHVELLPLIEADESEDTEEDEHLVFRNPLQAPRVIHKDTRYQREGQQIADKITSLIENKTLIGEADNARELQFGDIMILVRARTQASYYEQALRERDIPYQGATQVALLETLEVNDMICLLQTLQAPLNNLALANVLRSPLFCCSNQDLIKLATYPEGKHWYDKLQAISEAGEANPSLASALETLQKWRVYASYLPIHDLLDHIYFERDLIRRYCHNAESHEREQIAGNLRTFINLALEVDSGRYPSIGRFLSRLEELKANGHQSEKEAQTQAVRIMTIHGSKGLEAPIVFIAGAAEGQKSARPYRALVNWPANEARPKHFVLLSKKEQQDALMQQLLQIEARRFDQEDMNLLYVALTRARQHLYISACRPSRGKAIGWYGLLQQCIPESLTLSNGEIPRVAIQAPQKTEAPIAIDPRLSQAFAKEEPNGDLRPSQSLHDSEYFDDQGRIRGIAIHRFIELVTNTEQADDKTLLSQVGSEIGLPTDNAQLLAYLNEAKALVTEEGLKAFFDAQCFDKAYNEVAIQFKRGQHWVNGVIDRLVVSNDEVTIIDYKTHRVSEAELSKTANEYTSQMHLYAQGIQQMWPGKQIRCFLIFSYPRKAFKIDSTLSPFSRG